jgi:hypothetical protein
MCQVVGGVGRPLLGAGQAKQIRLVQAQFQHPPADQRQRRAALRQAEAAQHLGQRGRNRHGGDQILVGP